MQIRPLFSLAEIEARIEALADELQRDYADSPFVILSIAEGAVRFTEALVEALARRGTRPAVHSLRARRTRGTELAEVQVESFDTSGIDGHNLLVVDDVADEGRTLRAVLEIVALAEPLTVRTAVLVRKHSRSGDAPRVDYAGFEVDGGWVVGFGMDINGELRDLDEIGVVTDFESPPAPR